MTRPTRPECLAIGEELVAYVDGELATDAYARVADHLTGCLPCRRELESVKSTARLLAGLSRIAPAPDFAARMQRRLAAATDGAAGSGREWSPGWGLALAAAAAVALALVSVLDGGRGDLPGALPETVARAPAVAPAAGPAVPARAAAGAPAAGRPRTVAVRADDALSPEDLPPDLMARPELYLRLPVVRRLDTLEHFEAGRRSDDPERVGAVPRASAGTSVRG